MSFPSSYATRRRLWPALVSTALVLAIAAPAADACTRLELSTTSSRAPHRSLSSDWPAKLVGSATGGANPSDCASGQGPARWPESAWAPWGPGYSMVLELPFRRPPA